MNKKNPYDKIVDDLEKQRSTYNTGFIGRLFSSIIDWVILVIVLKLFGLAESPHGSIGLSFGFGGIIVIWLYYSILESSALQGTIGKLLLGQKVVNSENERIGFLQSTGRTWAKVLTVITLFIGYLMIIFTSQKQALHDMISGTYVVTSDETT